MYRINNLESGYDFITLYFESHKEMEEAATKLYRYMKRVGFKHYDVQRKNLTHKPGDIPHFHNGTPASKGPHFHVIYPDRPEKQDWEELINMCKSKLVEIELNDFENEEIS